MPDLLELNEMNKENNKEIKNKMTKVLLYDVNGEVLTYEGEKMDGYYHYLHNNNTLEINKFIEERKVEPLQNDIWIKCWSRPFYETIQCFSESMGNMADNSPYKDKISKFRTSCTFTLNDNAKRANQFQEWYQTLLEYTDNDMRFEPKNNNLYTCNISFYQGTTDIPDTDDIMGTKDILVTVNHGPGVGKVTKENNVDNIVICKGSRRNDNGGQEKNGASVAGMGQILASSDLGYVTVMISVSNYEEKFSRVVRSKQEIRIYWLKHYLIHEERIFSWVIQPGRYSFIDGCDTSLQNAFEFLKETTIFKNCQTMLKFLQDTLGLENEKNPINYGAGPTGKFNTGFVRVVHGLKESFKKYFEGDKFEKYLNQNLIIDSNKIKIKVKEKLIQPIHRFPSEINNKTVQYKYEMKDNDNTSMGHVYIGLNPTELLSLEAGPNAWQPFQIKCEKSNMHTRGPVILIGKNNENARVLQQQDKNFVENFLPDIKRLTIYGNKFNTEDTWLFHKLFENQKNPFKTVDKACELYEGIEGIKDTKRKGNKNTNRFVYGENKTFRLGRHIYVCIIIEPYLSTACTNKLSKETQNKVLLCAQKTLHENRNEWEKNLIYENEDYTFPDIVNLTKNKPNYESKSLWELHKPLIDLNRKAEHAKKKAKAEAKKKAKAEAKKKAEAEEKKKAEAEAKKKAEAEAKKKAEAEAKKNSPSPACSSGLPVQKQRRLGQGTMPGFLMGGKRKSPNISRDNSPINSPEKVAKRLKTVTINNQEQKMGTNNDNMFNYPGENIDNPLPQDTDVSDDEENDIGTSSDKKSNDKKMESVQVIMYRLDSDDWTDNKQKMIAKLAMPEDIMDYKRNIQSYHPMREIKILLVLKNVTSYVGWNPVRYLLNNNNTENRFDGTGQYLVASDEENLIEVLKQLMIKRNQNQLNSTHISLEEQGVKVEEGEALNQYNQ